MKNNTQSAQNTQNTQRKTVYKLKPNGDFEKVHQCQKCPVTGEHIFLPPHYTEDEPPQNLQKFEKAKHENGAWRVVKIDKGKKIFSKTNAGVNKICEEDIIPPGWTLKDPESETATGMAANSNGKLKPEAAKWDGKNDKWIVDTVKVGVLQAQKEIAEEEALISAEMRAVAIERLGDRLKKVKQ